MSAPRRLLALLVALLALAAAPAAALAQAATCPDPVSLPDLEDEVMCPICGTALNLADAPQADEQRAFIRRRIDACATKDEIKDALVAEYGPEVLALPRREGFGLAAYLVPGGAALAAALALGLALPRWRRRRAGDPAGSPGTEQPGPVDGPAVDLDPDDARRLEQDLARYER